MISCLLGRRFNQLSHETAMPMSMPQCRLNYFLLQSFRNNYNKWITKTISVKFSAYMLIELLMGNMVSVRNRSIPCSGRNGRGHINSGGLLGAKQRNDFTWMYQRSSARSWVNRIRYVEYGSEINMSKSLIQTWLMSTVALWKRNKGIMNRPVE